MNEQLKILVELQELDSSILSLDEKIASLPGRLKQYTLQLKEAKNAFLKFKTKHDDVIKKKKDQDLKLDETQDKIDKFKSRNSDIKTNREYEAHLKEIESFEKNRYKIEDEILALMEKIEEYSGEIQEEEKKVKKVEDDFALQEKSVTEDQNKLKSEMETQTAKRKDYISRIDEENYRHYKNLLERVGGLSVVQTDNEVCLGCNTNIPPQLYNDIKKNEKIYTCFYCKRFLYYKEPSTDDNKTKEKPLTP